MTISYYKKNLLLLILTLFLAAFPLQAAAQETEQIEVHIDSDIPALLKADNVESDTNTGLTRFNGHISIVRGSESLSAERAIWHDKSNTVELSGSVKIFAPDFTIIADRAVVNMDLQLAKIYRGRAFFPANNYYLSGDLIERQGENTFHIIKGKATTCDGPEPPWTIEANELTVTNGAYATATGVSLKSKYMPLFYSPFFLFPVKNERQTGLLMPGITQSNRDGTVLSLPFFWATGENHDLTYTPVWRSDRGLSHTIEGRYHLDYGRGIWQATYLKDDKPQSYAYRAGGPGVRKNSSRYWIRGINDWRINDWEIGLDVDLLSDPLFLAEYRNDIDGFFNSNRLFLGEFGHSFSEYLNPMRSSRLYAQTSSYDSFFRGQLNYNQDLYSRHNADTIQRLPSLNYYLVSRPLLNDKATGTFNNPLFSLTMNYDYFYRKTTEFSPIDETGHRLHIAPDISWNHPIGDLALLNIKSDLGLSLYAPHGHSYALDTFGRQQHHKNWDSHLDGSIEAKISSTFSRVFDGGPGDAVSMRHQMTPFLSFTFVESADQDMLPYWDMFDRRLPRRTLRFGLNNTLVSKTPLTNANGEISGYDYFQFLKLNIYSSYELADNSRWQDKPRARYYSSLNYFDKGMGPVEIELEASFNPYLSARILTAIDGREGKVTNNDVGVTLKDSRGDFLSINYEFDAPLQIHDVRKYEEVRANAGIVFTPEWSAGASARFDLLRNKAHETSAHLRYQAQCYGISLLYSRAEDETRVGLMVDLLGLGSIQSR